jgi:hypothetical protein
MPGELSIDTGKERMGEHNVKDNNENARGTWQSSGSEWYFKPNIRGKK